MSELWHLFFLGIIGEYKSFLWIQNLLVFLLLGDGFYALMQNNFREIRNHL